MGTPNVNEVVKKLNSRFGRSLVRFKKSENNNVLPTIVISIKPNKYVSKHFFGLTDEFYVELHYELKKMGIEDITFNNTRHTFWWQY